LKKLAIDKQNSILICCNAIDRKTSFITLKPGQIPQHGLKMNTRKKKAFLNGTNNSQMLQMYKMPWHYC
jgi:hypothetical protein